MTKDIKIGINHIKINDPILLEIIKNSDELNLMPETDYFSSLIKIIVGQQLSLKSAAAINKRLFDTIIPLTPESIINSSDNLLKEIGLSSSKIKYIKNLSEKIILQKLPIQNLDKYSDEEIEKMLIIVKGIGKWSVDMFLIFSLNRLNVLPFTDLGIRKAIQKNYKFAALPTEKEIKEVSIKNKWAPFNTIASYYLWKSLEIN